MKKSNIVSRALSVVLVSTVLSGLYVPSNVKAVETELAINGQFYQWTTEGNKYQYSTISGQSTAYSDTYGDFSIVGDLNPTEDHNGFKSYFVGDDSVFFKYLYNDSLISSNDSGDVNWHITNDNQKQVGPITLDSKVNSGAIIIQSSLDGEKWHNDAVYTDVFSTTPVQTASIYSTNDIQLLNGTYYRFIVAYKMRKLSGTHGWWIFRTSSYDYYERAEVYEFYLENEQSYNYIARNSNQLKMGDKVNAGSHDGFAAADPIGTNDPHYGWDLGRFFVSGYTEKRNFNGKTTFLKTQDDKIELSFEMLEKDLNCLHNNPDLVISDDNDGTDRYFQTDRNVKFRHGALIIRQIDYRGIPGEPQIYTDFLAANTSPSANTRISLFEEGDYEVALDYEICNKYGIDSYKNYRIFFDFSIRNGNTVVFPFDAETRSELSSMSTTPNGFYLDLAKSRYLQINVKRFTLNSQGNALDAKSNSPASDLERYTENGIYLIYAKNAVTGEKTRKIICVGSDYALNNYFRTQVVTNPSILTED